MSPEIDYNSRSIADRPEAIWQVRQDRDGAIALPRRNAGHRTTVIETSVTAPEAPDHGEKSGWSYRL